MNAKQIYLSILSFYVMMVGLVYAATIILDLPLFNSTAPGSYYLMAIAVFFFSAGIFFMIKALKGELKRKGGTIIDVRLEAVQKMNSIELLAQIAKNDPVAKVRKKAKDRLKEIAG